MPAYTYKCEVCENEFDTFHSITEELHNCDKCNNENSLKRVPQLLTSYSKQRQSTIKVQKSINFRKVRQVP